MTRTPDLRRTPPPSYEAVIEMMDPTRNTDLHSTSSDPSESSEGFGQSSGIYNRFKEPSLSRTLRRFFRVMFTVLAPAAACALRYEADPIVASNGKPTAKLFCWDKIMSLLMVCAVMIFEFRKFLKLFETVTYKNYTRGFFNVGITIAGLITTSIVLDTVKVAALRTAMNHNQLVNTDCQNFAYDQLFSSNTASVLKSATAGSIYNSSVLNGSAASNSTPVWIRPNSSSYTAFLLEMTSKGVMLELEQEYVFGMMVFSGCFALAYFQAHKKWRGIWLLTYMSTITIAILNSHVGLNLIALGEHPTSLLMSIGVAFPSAFIAIGFLRRMCFCNKECWKKNNDVTEICPDDVDV